MTAQLDIDVDRADPRWPETLLGDVAAVARAALIEAGAPQDGAVVVRLADSAEIAGLNAAYRHKDGPTNVLSFPAPDWAAPHLGDVILSFEVCAQEATDQGKTLRDHALHLTVHGVLHLLGYDHMTEVEAEEMEHLECRILAEYAVKDPYA